MPATPGLGSRPSTASASHRIRFLPHLEGGRAHYFDAMEYDIKEGGPALQIGRLPQGACFATVNAPGCNRCHFDSKVVSRTQAQIWVENGGRFFVRDTASLSGTFLNQVRLLPVNAESRSYQIRDGDILQLGVDFEGGEVQNTRSVRIRVEVCGRRPPGNLKAINTTVGVSSARLPSPTLAGQRTAGPSSPPVTQVDGQLSDEQAELVAKLHDLSVPKRAIASVIERMLIRNRDAVEALSMGEVNGNQTPLESPPAYDFTGP